MSKKITLTDLEFSVLVRFDLTDRQARKELDIRTHDHIAVKHSIFTKLGVESEAGAIFRALELGLLLSPFTTSRTLANSKTIGIAT